MLEVIVKKSGLRELFQPKKIHSSMRNANVSRDTAEWVSKGIHHYDGITTAQVRNQVIAGIREREPQAARTFETFVSEQTESRIVVPIEDYDNRYFG